LVIIVDGEGSGAERKLLLAMFKERKRLFVDLLKWDVPVVGSCEIDEFDGKQARYLIATGKAGEHEGSLRLLPSEAPHVLSKVFPALCDCAIPSGPGIYEISRLCLPARFRAPERLAIRHRLISAMVDHALGTGISALTGVVDASFLEQVLVMGWRSSALGYPRRIGRNRLGAFRIEIDSETPDRLAATGIYRPGCLATALSQTAAA
jgi:acyl-homoserine lactone synthase